MKKILFLLFLIARFFVPVQAQGTGDVRFRYLGMSNGLPAYGVRSLAQDEDGFIWIGTDKGLCRYDGVRIQTFSTEQAGWDHPYVTSMAVTHNNVWVGTDNGVWRLDRLTEQLSPLEGVNETGLTISNLSVSVPDSTLWISTREHGVFRYQPRTHHLQHYPMHETGGKTDYIYCDAEGNVWILVSTSATQPLWRLNRANRQFVPVRLQDPSLLSGHGTLTMLMSREGKRYIGSYHMGVLQLESNGHLTPLILPQIDHTGDLLDAMAETQTGDILLATGGGLLSYQPHTGLLQRVAMSEQDEGSGTRFLHSLLVDTEGGIWCGTFYGGVTYISPLNQRFHNETSSSRHANGLKLEGNVVEAFCEDKHGNIWIGTDDGGLSLYNPNSHEFLDFPFRELLREKNIHALLCEDDWLWVGTYTDGIYHIHTPSGRMHHYTTANGLADNSCYSLYRDHQGRLWAATFASAMLFSQTLANARQNDGSIGTFSTQTRLGSPTSDIQQDAAGNIWFATQGNGLWRYNPSKHSWKNIRRGRGLASDMVNDLHLDNSGHLWVCTDKGLYQYDPRKQFFHNFNDRHNLPSNDVSQLISDGETFWISTTNGLVKLSSNDSLHIFNKDDGLPGNQFLPSAGIITTDGQLFFGTTDGFCSFRPSLIALNQQAPRVFITSLSVLGQTLQAGSDLMPLSPSHTTEITLPHDAASFIIHFAALSYAAPQKNSYYYALEGYDSIWREPIGTTSATYTNLSPGTYVFHVRATNNDGVLSLNEARLRITVSQPWWWTPLARVLYLLVLFFVCTMFLYLRHRRRMKRERQIAAVDKDLIPKLDDLIGKNLDNPLLSVNFLAEQLGMSRTALFGKLKLVTTVTPNEMIQQARLNRAAQLLRDGNLSVTEICQAVGMSSPSYFSKCFQQHFGCKPSEYGKKKDGKE